MKPQEVQAGDKLKVRVVSIKDTPEARYLTVGLEDPDLDGPVATFRYHKAKSRG